MKYEKLNTALNNANDNFMQVSSFSNEKAVHNETIIAQGILDILIWKYNVSTEDFRLISSDFGYRGITSSQFKKFLQAIKPCFQDYFIDYFISFLKFLTSEENIKCFHKYQFQSFIPIKLEPDDYFLSTLYIIPKITNNKELQLYFAVVPLKKYNDEPLLTLNVIKDHQMDHSITQQLKNMISLENILTKEQTDIFNLMLKGYSSKKIASFLNKKHDNILKYNPRIKSRMSSFFDIHFDSAIDAANYYKNCFLLN